MNVEKPPLDAATADREFSELIQGQAASCLWFMPESRTLSVMEPAAEQALDAIVRHGTRNAWQQAKRLQAWRSRHIK